jgi:hypothetical protein
MEEVKETVTTGISNSAESVVTTIEVTYYVGTLAFNLLPSLLNMRISIESARL